jgi:uncharacterized membrane protein/Mg-chelatase subunit ChlD
MELPFSLSEPRALLLLLSVVPVVYLGMLGARARPRDRRRINTSTAIRAVILTLLTLALAGLQWISHGGPLNVVFLIDESASVAPATQQAAVDYVRTAIAGMGPEERAGVVLFGEKAIIDRAISGSPEWKPFGEHPAGLATNIADAIQVAVALFPEGGSRRLVLLSDGLATAGQAASLASRAQQNGIQLSVVPLGVQSGNEVSVEKVASPGSVPKGQKYDARVLLKSTSDRTATVTLYDGDTKVGTQTTQVQAGQSVLTFNLQAKDEGFRVLRATVTSIDDRYTENNEASSFTVVRTPPQVLIVASADEDANPLKQALTASGIDVAVTAPEGMPTQLDDLAKYDTVVLANASAQSIGVEREQMLQTFVRDMGHGLVMLGGEVSFGAGGYLRSTLEEVLPVNMDVRTSEQRASIAMTFLMDKSGSMGRCHCGGTQQFDPSMRTEFGPSKVEISKQAIARAAALLNSSDRVGVVGFDSAAHEYVPLETMGAIGANGIQQTLKTVDASGGPTNLHAGLAAAIEQLQTSDAELKHIILISDGWTQQADFTQQINTLANDNITLTTVGAGEGPGDIMTMLADKGGGRYYTATNVYALPDVLLKETVRLAGQYYIEKPQIPQPMRDSPILAGLGGSLPQILGYNATTAKPNAEVILKSSDGDPVLAQWQYGLGRSVAWTPDMKGRWATDWVSWPKFSQFAGQLVSWTVPQSVGEGLQTEYTLSPGAATTQDVSLRVESVDSAGNERDGLITSVSVTNTAGSSFSVPFVQGSPGVYSGVAKGLDEGVYQVQITQRSPETGNLVAQQTTGFVVPYPAEYRLVDNAEATARQLTSDLAQLGGGQVLSMQSTADVWRHDIVAQPMKIPLWPWLILAAILLFPVDVAVRRLSVTWSELLGRTREPRHSV